jgi:hypothetical protein
MEKYTQARLKDLAPMTTENWCAALFFHDTVRPTKTKKGQVVPPQAGMHTHSVIFNMTLADKIRSMDPQWLYRVQTLGTAVYRGEMYHDALEYGYELMRNPKSRHAMEIKGFSREFLEAMSLRTKEIEEEKERRDVRGAEADEIVNKAIRQPKGDWTPEEIRAANRAIADSWGVNTGEIQGQARERGGYQMSPQEREKAANEGIDHAVARLFEGQAVNDYFEILRDAIYYKPGLRARDIDAEFEKRRGEFIQVGHDRANSPGARYTTPVMRAMEQESIEIILRKQGTVEPIAGALTKEELEAEHRYRIGADGKEIRLNKAQMRASYHVLTSQSQYVIVAGAAGVGKSSSFEVVADVAEQHERAGYQVVGMAATSGATNNLRAMGIEAITLQRHNAQGVPAGTPRRLYLLDEGSLVGVQSFRRFLDSVRCQDRVIIAYDHRQHHSVEAGAIVRELEDAGVETVRLEKIVRQEENPRLLEIIEKFRDSYGPGQSDRMIEGLQMLDEDCHVLQVPKRVDRFEWIAAWFAQDPDRAIAISPDNASIAELDQAIREKLQAQGSVGSDVYEGTTLMGVRDIREADKKRAASYNVDDIVRWTRSSTLGGRARVSSGQYTRVLVVDTAKNEV